MSSVHHLIGPDTCLTPRIELQHGEQEKSDPGNPFVKTVRPAYWAFVYNDVQRLFTTSCHPTRDEAMAEANGWIDHFWPGHLRDILEKMTYESVVSFHEHQAEEALSILNEQGREAALAHLEQWHYPGEHETCKPEARGTTIIWPWGNVSQTFEKDGYILAYNKPIQSIGLYFKAFEE